MDAARFPPSRERAPAADVPSQRTSPPILDRFRAMLRDREEEEEGRPLATEDVVSLYEEALLELTCNSKPVITDLTIIAGEQREHAAGIVEAICLRILDVPVEQKLPFLYLLDSIVKNIGSEYVRYFSIRLPEVFCEAFYQVPPSIQSSMRHLFGTWSSVFSSSVRGKIQNELRFSPPPGRRVSVPGNFRNSESPSPRPPHGIHVNPKYLEAQHQFDRPVSQWEEDPGVRRGASDFEDELMERRAAEVKKERPGGSSKYRGFHEMDMYNERKTSHLFADYHLDSHDAVGQAGVTRGGLLQGSVGRGLSITDSKSNRLRRLPGTRDFSQSSTDGNLWKGKKSLVSDTRKAEAHVSYDIASELSAIRSRELIDAYGNNKRESSPSRKPSKIQRIDGNDINAESTGRNWQASEEEEYLWEDMSPTLADRDGSRRLIPNDVNFRVTDSGPLLKKPDASILDVGFGRNNWSLHSRIHLDVPSAILDEKRASVKGSGTGSTSRGTQISMARPQTSPFIHEPWQSHYLPQKSTRLNLSPRSHGTVLQPPCSTVDVVAVSRQKPSSAPPKGDLRFESLSSVHSESINPDFLPALPSSVTAQKKPLGQGPTSARIVPSTTWPSVVKPHSLSSVFVHSQTRPSTERLRNTDTSRSAINQGIESPFSAPWQPSDTFDRQLSGMPAPRPSPTASIVPTNLDNQSKIPQFPPQDPQASIMPSIKNQTPESSFHLSTEPQATYSVPAYLNTFSLQPSFPPPRAPESSFHMKNGLLPPLPPGPPPAIAQTGSFSTDTSSVSSSIVSGGISGLINSLVSHGLISLTQQNTFQDEIGVDFNPDHLKVRHESAINDLYLNLPRQCTTCGLRFKSRDEHSNHMDWHVTKNRISRNRKQKPSRKWFVTLKEWLSGAETVGVDAVPGFLPMEAISEKCEEKELAVPADDNQKLCALCGEPFEDFYSDEADEWMYKGAVYMNAPEGYSGGRDRIELGPIVHDKCRSESNVQRQL